MEKRLWFLIVFICCVISLRADHMLGGELSYQMLDSSQGVYEVTLVLERYCSGGSYPSSQKIQVVEYSQGIYKTSFYVADLVSKENIPMPCGSASASCMSSNTQMVERNFYRVNIITDPTSKECLVFYKGNDRVYADNILNPYSPLFLYLSFIPKYVNHQYEWKEEQRHFPLKGQYASMRFSAMDVENDSLLVLSSAPFEDVTYTTNNNILNYSFQKLMLGMGLFPNKPIFMSEAQLMISKNKIGFTPSQLQNSWLTLEKIEYRKINLGAKDTWIVISKSNSERLLTVNQLNTNFRLDTIISPNTNVFIANKSIVICHQGDSFSISFRFPIEKTLSVNKNKILSGVEDVTSQFAVQRVYGNAVDTMIYNLRFFSNEESDINSSFVFQIDLCHSASGVGFDKRYEVPFTVFHYKIFELDTILSCSPSLWIPIMVRKPISASWGVYSPFSIYISAPKDTMIVATLSSSNSFCPSKDTVYLNHGSVFTSEVTSHSPTCRGYADGSAKVKVTGTNTPYSFLWSNFSTLDSVSSLYAGSYIVCIRDKDNCKQYDTIVINDPLGIESRFVVDTPITCYGGNNGRGHIQILSALRPTLYTWFHNLSTDSFVGNLSHGTYLGKYQYLNTNGISCQQNFSFAIDQPDSIVLQISKYDNVCFGENYGKISVLPKGGKVLYKYYFDNTLSNTGLKLNLPNGTYQIYVVDSLQCHSSTAAVTITSPPRINVSAIKTDPICPEVSNGTVVINHVSGGVAPYFYSFDNSAYTYTTTYPNLGVKNYSIHVKDANGCIVPQTIALNPQYVLTAKLDSIVHSRCPNTHSGKIVLTMVNGIKPYVWKDSSYTQSFSTINLSLRDLFPRWHTIEIKDDAGCQWKDSFILTEPSTLELDVLKKDESCYKANDGSISIQSIKGGTPPYGVLKWYDGANNFVNSTTALSPDIYTLRMEDANHCSYLFQYPIIAKPLFKVEIVALKSISCHGYSDGLLIANTTGGVSPLSYQWNGNALWRSDTLKNVAPNSYRVEVIDADKCKVEANFTMTEPTPIVVDEVKVKNNDCLNGSTGAITVNCSGGSTPNSKLEYGIENRFPYSTKNVFSDLGDGSYTIKVRDERLCEISLIRNIITEKSIEVSLPSFMKFNLGEITVLHPSVNLGFQTALSDVRSAQWTPSLGISCGDCIQTNFTPIKSGNYILEIHYGNGCIAKTNSYFEVTKPDDVFIPNSFSPNGDNKNDTWYVYGRNVKSIDIRVLNRVGELLFYSNDILKGWDGKYANNQENQVTAYKYVVKVTYLDNSVRDYEGILNLIK